MKQELTISQLTQDKSKLIKFIDLYSLKLLLEHCILKTDLDILMFDIPLSNYGKKIFKYLRKLKKFELYSDSLIKFSLFNDFYYSELYFNLDTINLGYLENIINEKIKSRDILFPWVYDRLLYDKYFIEFNDQDEVLDYEESLKLLNNTPQGVFQVNQYLTGPFGLITSPIKRLLRPKLKFKLWHCSNPSCEAFHSAELENDFSNGLNLIIQSIHDFCKNHDVDPYEKLFNRITYTGENYYNDKSVDNIIEFVLNCFVEDEIRTLIKVLLDETNMRVLLPDLPLFKKSASDIVQKLNKAECSQLLLLCSDDVIIKSIENLIYTKEIFIPSTETRKSYNQKYKGFYNTFPECNKLGIRINSASSELSIVRLKFLLKTIYNDPSLTSMLEWKLKNYSDNHSLDEKLENYIMQEDPRRIVQDTIMSGLIQLNKTFEVLGGYYVTPKTKEEEDHIIDKVLWKLGFDVNIYPKILNKFYEYLRKFTDAVNQSINYNENDKDNIRSAGVNLFVSLEEVLQLTLSYMTWILLSDHYTETKFKFVYEDAREFMASQLDKYEFSDGQFLEIDRNGKNTLFPLIEGFNSLIAICDKLISGKLEDYKKPKSELPHFHENDQLKQFPFVSKKLIFDIRHIDYQNIKSVLLLISKEFGKAMVLPIRNKLQHQRDVFPLQEELLEASQAIGNVISKLDNMNLFPNVFLFTEKTIDKYKRNKVIFENYKGNHITIIPTPEFENMYMPSLDIPQLILPAIKLGLTSHVLRIEYKEKSNFQQFWKGYPRKKTTSKRIENASQRQEIKSVNTVLTIGVTTAIK